MTPITYALTPDLFRRGTPVRVSLASDAVIQGVYLFGRVVCQDGGPMDWYDIGTGSEDVAPEEVALDLADPLGMASALLWLRERGHDLRWAEGEPEVIAWSVASVARGGPVIVGLIGARQQSHRPLVGPRASPWFISIEYPPRRVRPTDPTPYGWRMGDASGRAATSLAAFGAAEAAALAAHYALRNEDGLQLPAAPNG